MMIRLTQDMLDRADKMKPYLDRDPWVEPKRWRMHGVFPRTTVLRLAMIYGLEVMEEKYSDGR